MLQFADIKQDKDWKPFWPVCMGRVSPKNVLSAKLIHNL